MRAPERLISSLGALGRGARRRRRVLRLFVCVFVRSGGSPGGRPRPTHKGNLKVLSARVGRGRAGRDPPTKKTLRFPLFCDPPVATHPTQRRDPPGATHPPRPTRCDPPSATHPSRPTRRALTLIGEGRALGIYIYIYIYQMHATCNMVCVYTIYSHV